MKNLKELNENELKTIEGGAPSWSWIYNEAYKGHWEHAIGGIGDKIEEFFE